MKEFSLVRLQTIRSATLIRVSGFGRRAHYRPSGGVVLYLHLSGAEPEAEGEGVEDV